MVITIGRECGSQGHSIGKALAEQLGVKFYDKELLEISSKNSGLVQELFETFDEKKITSFLYTLVMNMQQMGQVESPISQKVYLAQFNTIRKLAEEDDCVFVGRTADYVLAERKDLLSVFIYADESDKIRHIMDRYEMTEKDAKAEIRKLDKNRESYYNFYTGKKWGDSRSYNLCINSSKVGVEGAVNIIVDTVDWLQRKEEK